MPTALALAILSSLCFGVALVSGRIGLRTLDARSGAAISIPTATVLFLIASPFAFDAAGFTVLAALIFAAVGLFFPGLVTILTFRSNEQLGPTITGAVSGTAPLFALIAAGLLLGEQVPPRRPSLRSDRRGGWRPVVEAGRRGPRRSGLVAALADRRRRGARPCPGRCQSGPAAVAKPVLGRPPGLLGVLGRRHWSQPGWPLEAAATDEARCRLVRSHRRPQRRRRAPDVRGAQRRTGLAGRSDRGDLPAGDVLASAVVLREERVTPRMAAGAAITVLAMVYLVASKPGA